MKPEPITKLHEKYWYMIYVVYIVYDVCMYMI